ncbi:transposase [Actinoplanes sp. NPDC051861]|uniref:transposase n=1 Tax=Actinoplanes sp. NPDC051861 TaxID=3155170 RepID=UPI003420575F
MVDGIAGRMPSMPAPHPAEFRQRAVALARTGGKTIAQLAKDLSISESCLRNWLAQADADDGGNNTERLTSTEKQELAVLRRRNHQLEMENEILKRAAAYFARENILPK